MYFATPQRLREPSAAPVPLHITAVQRRAFDPSGDPSQGLERFISDLASPYGVAIRDEVLTRPHPSYSMMAEAMLGTATAIADPANGRDFEAPDLIVVAYAVPEVDPRQCVATGLNFLGAGDPFGFAVTDQGTAAPFTALALIREHLAPGGCQRGMLVVVEQAEVPYETPLGTALPECDTAVALSLEAVGSARVVALRQYAGVTPAQVDTAIAVELAALPAGPARVTVIGPDEMPAGMVCTAPWWALADQLDRSVDAPYRTVVVDYDATLGYLCLLAIDVASGHPEGCGSVAVSE